MRLQRFVGVVVVVMGLAACNDRERATMTGAYGSGVVSGAVVMANGGSPAGVDVAVGGTGMRMTVGADGRFAFANVPDAAELFFHRAADGLDARLTTVGMANGTTIELATNAARVSDRRRGGRGGERQTEGLVVSATATSLVVFSSHREEVTFKLTPETIIRHGHRMLTAEDLTEGTRVHVKWTQADDVRTATLVLAQRLNKDDDDDDDGTGENGGTTVTANGPVLAVGANSLTVRSQSKGDVTVRVDANTILKKQGKTIAVTDIHPGDEVNCRGVRIDETTMRAEQIEVRGKSGRH